MYGSGILPAVGLDENRKFPDVLTVVNTVQYLILADFSQHLASLILQNFLRLGAENLQHFIPTQ